MMPSRSAGILAFRLPHGRLQGQLQGQLQVLLVHPGGPYWRNKDLGAWSIPKGEYGPDESPEQAARREFSEELGIELSAPLLSLGEIRQRGGKFVQAFAAEFDVDVAAVHSNTFEMEWPPRSGQQQAFPEVDRAAWFDLTTARSKINEGQRPLLDRLETLRRESTS
jgi:predicted NUDIX family NTP pyrophosphohydrolase